MRIPTSGPSTPSGTHGSPRWATYRYRPNPRPPSVCSVRWTPPASSWPCWFSRACTAGTTATSATRSRHTRAGSPASAWSTGRIPTRPSTCAIGAPAAAPGFRLNLINETDVSWLLDPGLEPLWDAAASAGVSMSAQMRPVHAAIVGELARRRDDLDVIIDYLGPEAFHDATGISAVRDLALQPNTWFKILAFGTDSRRAVPFPRHLAALPRGR